jgi:hypothetical protein
MEGAQSVMHQGQGLSGKAREFLMRSTESCRTQDLLIIFLG